MVSLAKIPLIRVVDDDEDLRNSIEFLLICEGYQVATFKDARDFLANDYPSRPGCVILDVQMEDINGLELQEKLNSRGYMTPIIFLTAHGTIDMAVQTMREGACDFHQKPLEPTKFLPAVARAVEKDRQLRGGAVNSKEELLLYEKLTEREKKICRLVAQGFINQEIAERFGISKRTVDHHRTAALKKLGIRSVAQLSTFFERIDAFKEKKSTVF